ncbi:TPA: hypothetical protein QDE31_34580 [Burkholderia cenocepacia]|nr:hypothetical protein [Burkholderia cenocepacia]
MKQTVKPLLRWAGSKRKLLPLLRQHIPAQFSRYVEPFCGSACLFFELSPEHGLLGDINPELIHFYKRVRANPYRRCPVIGHRNILRALRLIIASLSD